MRRYRASIFDVVFVPGAVRVLSMAGHSPLRVSKMHARLGRHVGKLSLVSQAGWYNSWPVRCQGQLKTDSDPVLWGVLSTPAAWGKHLLETWSVREGLDGIFINSIRKWGPVMGGGRLLSTPKHAAVLQT